MNIFSKCILRLRRGISSYPVPNVVKQTVIKENCLCLINLCLQITYVSVFGYFRILSKISTVSHTFIKSNYNWFHNTEKSLNDPFCQTNQWIKNKKRNVDTMCSIRAWNPMIRCLLFIWHLQKDAPLNLLSTCIKVQHHSLILLLDV